MKGAGMTRAGDEAEVVIVGAGIAGLVAAWQLRDRNIRVLEATDRVGGRMRSVSSGDYWTNLGAHLFPSSETIVGRIADEMSLEFRDVHGHMAVTVGGKFADVANPLQLAALPVPWRDRAGLLGVGVRLLRGIRAYQRATQNASDTSISEARQRRLAFKDDETLAEYLHFDTASSNSVTAEILRSAAHRSGAEPDEMSAGAGLSLFAHVWAGRQSVTARNVVGGAEALPRALHGALGGRVLLQARASQIVADGDRVVVTYEHGAREESIHAEQVVLATPAAIAAEMAPGLPEGTLSALGQMRYGPYVCVGLFTNETRPMPWDDYYAIVTPQLSFDLFVNDANSLRARGSARAAGGGVRVMAGGVRAAALWELGDDAIAELVIRELDGLFPGFAAMAGPHVVQRWKYGNAYSTPGRAALQRHLEVPLLDGRLHLAGDYFVEDSSMDGAAQAAWQAAQRVRVQLGAETMGGRW
jgi:protoporphyrinogen/coproporphyrinogen III oxidase